MSSPVSGKLASIGRMPAELARQDLTPLGVAVLSFLVLALVGTVDMLDGRLGAPFAVAFVLLAATAPLATRAHGLLFTTVLPTVLLAVALLLIALVAPATIELQNLPKSASFLSRSFAAGLERGEILLVAQVFAIVSVLLRHWSLQGDRQPLL